MVITYHGGECFRIVFGDTTLALNPISKDSKLKSVRFGADIALVSLDHPDTNGVEQVAHGEREPLVIDSPGEYEVKRVAIRGFPSKSNYDSVPASTSGTSHSGGGRINTIYLIRLEGMNLCFLGALCEKKLPTAVTEALDEIDILFVPIGGGGVLRALDAHELSVELEGALVIPMHYTTSAGSMGETNALTTFLKEEGVEKLKPVDKLTVKKKDLSDKEGEVIVLGG